MKKRCTWTKENPYNIYYHDTEWGVKLHDDNKFFEFLILESFQAGLTWLTILKKRENFSLAFDNFDFEKIALYDEAKIEELMQNKGIIRNKLKINASINNAKRFIEIRKEFGTFDKYIWKFVDNKQIINRYENLKDIPATSKESNLMSEDLKKRGFKFVGSTICYAFMQATGLVNDNEISCFRYKEVI